MTRVLTQPPPDNVFWRPAPEGFIAVWEPEPRDRYRLLDANETPRKCRRPGCEYLATWELLRTNGWWAYCPDHNYGRRFENGEVLWRRLVPIEVDE